MDPIAYYGSPVNLYSLLANNPVLRVDPSGLAPFLAVPIMLGISLPSLNTVLLSMGITLGGSAGTVGIAKIVKNAPKGTPFSVSPATPFVGAETTPEEADQAFRSFRDTGRNIGQSLGIISPDVITLSPTFQGDAAKRLQELLNSANNSNSNSAGVGTGSTSVQPEPPAPEGSTGSGKPPNTPPTNVAPAPGDPSDPSGGASRTFPNHATDTSSTIRRTDSPPAGYRGGGTFQNDGRGGGQVLPRTTSNGTPITYREFDVHPHTPGVNRGTERIVVGSDGKAYYTDNHYRTFTEMR